MSQTTKSRLTWALRIGICGAALGYVISNVTWYDQVTLADGAKARLIELDESGATVFGPEGGRRTVARDDLRVNPASGEVEVSYGLRSAVGRVYGRWWLALLGLLAFAPSPVLLGARLRWLVRVQGVDLSLWKAVKVTYLGNFVSLVLPGLTGGDVVKAYYVARDARQRVEAVTAVFLDRLLGVVCLFSLAGLMILINWDDPAMSGWGPLVGLTVLMLVLGGMLYFAPLTRSFLRTLKVDRLIARLPLGSYIRRIDQAALAYRGAGRAVLFAAAATVVAQVSLIAALFFVGCSIGLVDPAHPASSFSTYLVYVPLATSVGAIPISIQGFGLMEETYIRLFRDAAHLATSSSEPFLLSLLGRAIQMFWALPGALVPAMMSRRLVVGEEPGDAAIDRAEPVVVPVRLGEIQVEARGRSDAAETPVEQESAEVR
jgi:uncharacterized protein (TIRG00374 family)